MNILITGCNGQLGNELRLIEDRFGEEYTFFHTFIEELDITDREAVNAYIQDNAIDLIINCAAFTAVDRAEEAQELCEKLNSAAPGYLAAAVEERGGNIIHVSTDYVFSGEGCVPYREDSPTAPQSVYGTTKLAGEERVIRSCAGAVIIRTAWLYSPFGNNFVKTMIRLGKEREELGVVADQIGSPTYAHDLAMAICQMVRHGLVPGVYHFTDEGTTSWYDFTRVIHREAGIRNCRVRPLHTEDYPTPAKRPHYSMLDKTKIKDTYGIDIPWWEDALKDCIERLKD